MEDNEDLFLYSELKKYADIKPVYEKEWGKGK